MMKNRGPRANIPDKSVISESALIEACKLADFHWAKKNLKAETISIHIADPQDGNSLLYHALHASVVNLPLIRLLIHHGADVNGAARDTGSTPIHWAAETGNVPVVHRLAEAGADLNACDNEGRTALHIAAEYGLYNLLEYLVHRDARWCSDAEGRTPLHLAARYGLGDSIVMLGKMQPGAVNAADRTGRTPLHYAALGKQADACAQLLKLGAQSALTDLEGATPADLAPKNSVVAYGLRTGQIRDWYRPRKAFYLSLAMPVFIIMAADALCGLLLFRAQFGPLYVAGACLEAAMFVVWLWLCNSDPGVITAQSHEVDSQKHFHALLSLPPPTAEAQGSEAPGEGAREEGERRGGSLEGWEDKARRGDPIAYETVLREGFPAPACWSCRIVRPIRSKHCPHCGACIMRFDHHCGWGNNCIGQKNYRQFVLFLFLVFVSMPLFLIFAHRYMSPGSPPIWSIGAWIAHRLVKYPFVTALWVVNLLLWIFTSGLLYAHALLIIMNLTTNELFNVRRYPHFYDTRARFRNPFNRGLKQNIREVLFRSEWVDYTHAYLPAPRWASCASDADLHEADKAPRSGSGAPMAMELHGAAESGLG
eukprot:gnl/Trimastix_PCT/368.p1 GENE.gnl/Trimastix_PCT/368~~gnl/Trimastix_PCT/368.p1  ORF type:complete len:595 (-),score=159.93 gnl/Trimastix_PCT/368:43-1827(-)